MKEFFKNLGMGLLVLVFIILISAGITVFHSIAPAITVKVVGTVFIIWVSYEVGKSIYK